MRTRTEGATVGAVEYTVAIAASRVLIVNVADALLFGSAPSASRFTISFGSRSAKVNEPPVPPDPVVTE
jgi:hypothetical protein